MIFYRALGVTVGQDGGGWVDPSECSFLRRQPPEASSPGPHGILLTIDQGYPSP